MKRLLTILSMVAIVLLVTSVSSKAQYAPPTSQRQTVKALDSTTVTGVPINTLVIRNVTISDSVAVVTSALVYRGTTPQSSRAQLIYTDTFALPDSQGLSINSAAALVATKRGVTLK